MKPVEARAQLAAALRALRREREAGPLSQSQVADFLGISNQQVSNWENAKDGQVPPAERLDAYARLFAVHELPTGKAGSRRLPEVAELSAEERASYEELRGRLTALRRDAVARVESSGFWAFGDGRPITIIGSEQAAELLASVPEADPHHPDYIRALRHADADAVFELQVRLQALNPQATVRVLLPSEVDPARDLQGHVVVTGGVSLNKYASWFVQEAGIEATSFSVGFNQASEVAAWWDRRFLVPRKLVPPEQVDEIEEDAERREFAVFRAEFRGTVEVAQSVGAPAQIRTIPGPSLYRDLAVIARQPNPVNLDTTATLVYGLFGQGTYGAALTFTAPEVQEENEAHVAERFGDARRFWLLVRVFCDRRLGLTTPPRLADPGTIVLQWTD